MYSDNFMSYVFSLSLAGSRPVSGWLPCIDGEFLEHFDCVRGIVEYRADIWEKGVQTDKEEGVSSIWLCFHVLNDRLQLGLGVAQREWSDTCIYICASENMILLAANCSFSSLPIFKKIFYGVLTCPSHRQKFTLCSCASTQDFTRSI